MEEKKLIVRVFREVRRGRRRKRRRWSCKTAALEGRADAGTQLHWCSAALRGEGQRVGREGGRGQGCLLTRRGERGEGVGVQGGQWWGGGRREGEGRGSGGGMVSVQRRGRVVRGRGLGTLGEV
ncbi:unnamed protein product [Closterium sp. NIES-54]